MEGRREQEKKEFKLQLHAFMLLYLNTDKTLPQVALIHYEFCGRLFTYELH